MKKIGLHWWIILGVLVGAALGSFLYLANVDAAREEVLGPGWTRAAAEKQAAEVSLQLTQNIRETGVYQAIDGLSTIFLKLLKMIVIPLVFFSLLGGIAGMGDIRRLGRIGVRTFAMYIGTSLLAIITGLVMVNAFRPGTAVDVVIPVEAEIKPVPDSPWTVITNMIPDNVVRSAADFDLIGVILFTLLFGVFLLMVEQTKKAPLVGVIDAGGDVMMKMTHFVISLAPVGIAALIARMVATTGPEVFISMLWYVVTVLASLLTHLFLTLPALIWLFTRRNPYKYMKAMSPALLTAFSTASSSGTLGVTLERTEKGAGVSNRVSSFVLPLGATINMDGTALYEIVSVIFIAQLHSAVDPNFTLTFGQQLLIVFLGLMVSIGAAGIPHAGLVMMVIILEAVGLPVVYTALIWTVDRLLDMTRTVVNVWSDSSICLIVAHKEGDVDDRVLFGA
jgi:proton glutamate symport protein